MKIAVLGAGGFVGSTLCERLYFEKEFEFVPIISSYSGAGRLGRLGLDFKLASVLDRQQIETAIAGCDAIVNCSRGDGIVMLKGLENIIEAAKAKKVKRIAHISSIAIYGTQPPAEATTEAAPACPDDPYGEWKAKQDEMLFKAHGAGLATLSVIPGNIYGPYSPFISGAAAYAKSTPIILVDEGRHPTNNVHVNNVAEGILAALRSDGGWGERYFVNEVERTTWREFYDQMCAIQGVSPTYVSVPLQAVVDALKGPSSGPARRSGIVDHLKILASGEFRKGLGILPVFQAVNTWTYDRISSLDPKTQARLRSLVERPTHIPKDKLDNGLDGKFVREQIRTIFASPEKAIRQLGFKPFSQRQGMQTVADWLQFISA